MTPVHLNRLLTLERPVVAADGAGGFATLWEVVGTVWGEIVPGIGRDAKGEETMLASVAYRITLRGAAVGSERRPVAGQRLREGARVFQILAVTERDAVGRYLTCFAREEAAR